MTFGNLKKVISGKGTNQVAFFNILGPIVLNGINLVTMPLFTALLNPEQYGVITLYTTWVQILTIVMGLQTSSSIATARVHLPEEKHAAYYSSVLTLSCIVSVVVSALVVLFIRPIAAFTGFSYGMIFLVLAQSFGAYMINFATMKYIHHKQAQLHFVLSVLVSGLSIVLALLLVLKLPSSWDRYWGRAIGYMLPNFVIGTVLLIQFFVRGKTGYRAEFWRFCLPLCLPLVFHSLSQIVLAQSDKVMIKSLMGAEGVTGVGIYGAVFNFAHLINVIYLALNNTWVPFYYDHVKRGEMEAVQRRSKNYIFLFTCLTMGFVLLSPEVLHLLVDKAYWSGGNLIPIMVISYYMVFLYSFPVNFELYCQRTRLVAVGTVMSALLNIVLNYWMIQKWQLLGATVATMISYVLLFVFHYWSAKYRIKDAKYHYKLITFIPGMVAVLAACAAYYFLGDYWMIRWGIGAAIGVLMVRRIIKNKSIF